MNPEGLSMSTPDPAIEHESHDRHGAFFIQREGRRVGELTYHLAGDTAIVGHTWVDPRLRGGGEAAPRESQDQPGLLVRAHGDGPPAGRLRGRAQVLS
jgi:hypothetical protein